MRKMFARSLPLLIGLAMLLAGCSGDAEVTTTIPPAAGDTSTTVETTTTTSEPSTTTSAPTTTTATTVVAGTDFITLYFATGDGTDCSQVGPFEREIPVITDPITAAFDLLVGGPTADEAIAGAGSFFSVATAESVRSVTLDSGLLTVDFEDFRAEISNASTSCGSASLIASLNATAFQFDDVERVRYTIFGSCNTFYNWLQGECQDQTRTGSVPVALDINEEASGSGCTPGTEQLPDGEWFGYVEPIGASTLEFDLACWFTGIPAAEAAAEDGQESPPPNDYYTRNQSYDLRTIPVGDHATVSRLVTEGGPDLTIVDFADWAAVWAERPIHPGVWLTITDGEVVLITEQYQP